MSVFHLVTKRFLTFVKLLKVGSRPVVIQRKDLRFARTNKKIKPGVKAVRKGDLSFD